MNIVTKFTVATEQGIEAFVDDHQNTGARKIRQLSGAS